MIPDIFPKIHHYRQEADLIHSVRRVVCLEKKEVRAVLEAAILKALTT